ncbi:MAG TPA: hypothetical protein VJQ61_12725 [Sinomonas sp.]|nr:hypothetical protein [Sinomonas sp.]
MKKIHHDSAPKLSPRVILDVPIACCRNAAQEPASLVEEVVELHSPVVSTIQGIGFLPAEEVSVAVIVGRTEAGSSGTAQAMLDPARFQGGEVIMLGQTSGTLVIRRLR